MSRTYYANPDETTFTGATYTFRFGAYGGTTVVVIQRPDCIDDALETAAECLKEHAPGLFSEPEYDLRCVACEGDAEGPCETCREEAETDHTYTESGWLLAHEWTVDESEGEPFESPRFDRFDICAAHHAYWSAWHQGQWSAGYAALSRAARLASNLPDSFDALTENGQAIYRQLVLQDGR